jgi:hypothetical protein
VAGGSQFTTAVSVTPPVPTIAANYIFYNDSEFDEENDSNAIATDKQVLLPGQTASFQNYTSYANGMNGLMIDVNNLDGAITAADFTFLVGNSSDITSWQTAPAPEIVSEFSGGGVDDSTRIELIWIDGAIQNTWLQVTLKADTVTQLAVPEVFYVGNAVGDTGNSPTDADVNSSDVLGARGHHDSGPVSVLNPYDFNRDGDVDATDVAIAQQNVRAAGAALQLITAPSGEGALSSQAVQINTMTIAAPPTPIVGVLTFASMALATPQPIEITPAVDPSELAIGVTISDSNPDTGHELANRIAEFDVAATNDLWLLINSSPTVHQSTNERSAIDASASSDAFAFKLAQILPAQRNQLVDLALSDQSNLHSVHKGANHATLESDSIADFWRQFVLDF